MSLYLDVSNTADVTSGKNDLATISWNDPGLSEGGKTALTGSMNGITQIPVVPVIYPSASTNQLTADRLAELANTSMGLNWGDPIVITPLNGGLDPYQGVSILGNGATYLDTNVTPNVVHVVYDTSQWGGLGISTYDDVPKPIATPNPVILYHELSHAYHHCSDQFPFPQTDCPDTPADGPDADEPGAELDENVLRVQLGLCKRDVCNHGSQQGWGDTCGGTETPGGPPMGTAGSSSGPKGGGPEGGGPAGGEPPPGGGGPAPSSWKISCFIVTAATGSPQAYEIVRLRALRDRIAGQSGLSKALIEAVYAEYFQFSPAMAAFIEDDGGARAQVRQLIIAPLFAWFQLAEALALDPRDTDKIDAAAVAVADACPPDLALFMVPMLESISRGVVPRAALSGRMAALAPAIERAARLKLASWALLAPLCTAWRLGSRPGRLAEAVADWLSRAPMETLPPPEGTDLDRELRLLAGYFDFAPAARRRLGRRLLSAWPDLREALARHEFV